MAPAICRNWRDRNKFPAWPDSTSTIFIASLLAHHDNKRSGDTDTNVAIFGISDGEIAALAHYAASR